MSSILAPCGVLSGQKVSLMVSNVAVQLQDLGINKDARIGLFLDVSIESVLILKACIEVGLTVALCPMREPSSIIAQWLQDLGITKVISSLPKPEGLNVAWVQMGTSSANSPKIIGADQAAHFTSIIRTSGSSGNPKSAVLRDVHHRASAHAVNEYFAISHQSCLLLSLPLYHVSGLSMVYRSMIAQASLFIASNMDEMKHGLKYQAVSHISLVPTQLKRLLDDGVDMSHLQAVIIGGDALHPHIAEEALKKQVPLYATYGLTETASMIIIRNYQNGLVTVLPHAQCMVAKDQEILVKGQSLFDGYVGAQGQLIKSFQQGWFATGDSLVDLNRLDVVVRKHNRIICGGENIQAEEIEFALESHADIDCAVVVGMADEYFGHRPVAFIKSRKILSKEEVLLHLKPLLASYKCPINFLPWPKDAPSSYKKPRRWFLTKMSQSLQ